LATKSLVRVRNIRITDTDPTITIDNPNVIFTNEAGTITPVNTATLSGFGSMVMGPNAVVSGDRAVAFGVLANASGYGSTCVGWNAAGTSYTTNLGFQSLSTGAGGMALGRLAYVTATNAICISTNNDPVDPGARLWNGDANTLRIGTITAGPIPPAQTVFTDISPIVAVFPSQGIVNKHVFVVSSNGTDPYDIPPYGVFDYRYTFLNNATNTIQVPAADAIQIFNGFSNVTNRVIGGGNLWIVNKSGGVINITGPGGTQFYDSTQTAKVSLNLDDGKNHWFIVELDGDATAKYMYMGGIVTNV
jgi:hypothetical protein